MKRGRSKAGTKPLKTVEEYDPKAVVRAILSNKPSDLATLLAKGCNPEAAVTGHSPLFHAVLEARPGMVELLLQHGADWRKRDRVTGWTPLMMATINAHRSARRQFTGRAIQDSKKVVKVLTAAGAKDLETTRVLGNHGNESDVLARAIVRRTRADERVLEIDGALVVLPPRFTKKFPARFDTVEEYARRRGWTRWLQTLIPAS